MSPSVRTPLISADTRNLAWGVSAIFLIEEEQHRLASTIRRPFREERREISDRLLPLPSSNNAPHNARILCACRFLELPSRHPGRLNGARDSALISGVNLSKIEHVELARSRRRRWVTLPDGEVIVSSLAVEANAVWGAVKLAARPVVTWRQNPQGNSPSA